MKSIFNVLLFLALFTSTHPTEACTVFYVNGSPDHLVAKNTDWFADQGLIFINKRNVQKKAVWVGANQQGLTWISKYMSLTLTQDARDFPWEGMNEAGLSVNVLELIPSKVPPPDTRPAIEQIQWIQYILDTSATVAEAITNAQKTRIGVLTTVHFFVCDNTPSCATFEYIDGDLVIHQSESSASDLPFPALTNDTYDHSLVYFQNQFAIKTKSEILSSKNPRSLDRFTRGALWSIGFQQDAHEYSYAFNGLRNTAQTSTQWSIVFNLNSKILALKTKAAPKVKWIDLKQFNPSCLTPVRVLDMNFNPSDSLGDSIRAFEDYTPSINQKLIQMNTYTSAGLKQIEAIYPETYTKCLEGLR